MKQFIEFVKSLHANRFENLFAKIKSEEIPCAIYAPLISKKSRFDRIKYFRDLGVNVTTLFTIDPDDFENPPHDVDVINFPPPKNKIQFVFIDGHMPCTSAVPRFCELGIRPIRLEMSGTKDPLFSFFMDRIDELFEIYNVIDQPSRNSLLGYILGLISNDFSFYRFSETNEYILREFIPQPNEIVIDGGSADGATAAMFKDLGCQVYSFEIDHENFKIASKLASEKNFTVENLGLSDFVRIATYHAGKVDLYGKTLDSAEEINSDEIMETRLISIDEYVREKNLPRVDLIKLNIMGAELQALRGATTTISRFKPKLMINTYLPPIQLFEAFKLLRALCPDYEFACRQWTGSFENYSKMFDSQLLKYIEKYNLPRKWFHISGLMLFAR